MSLRRKTDLKRIVCEKSICSVLDIDLNSEQFTILYFSWFIWIYQYVYYLSITITATNIYNNHVYLIEKDK